MIVIYHRDRSAQHQVDVNRAWQTIYVETSTNLVQKKQFYGRKLRDRLEKCQAEMIHNFISHAALRQKAELFVC